MTDQSPGGAGSPRYALGSALGRGSAAMFGYQMTNQNPIAPRAPSTNRWASRAVATTPATGRRATVTTSAIGSTGIDVNRSEASLERRFVARTKPIEVPTAITPAPRTLPTSHALDS